MVLVRKREVFRKAPFEKSCAVTANDPKLSDGGGWRAGCMVGGKAAAEAAPVTPGAVRCRAWLGGICMALSFQNVLQAILVVDVRADPDKTKPRGERL